MDNILCQLNSITLFLQGQEEGEENISLLWGLPFHLPGPYQVVLVPQPSSCISPHLSPSAIHRSLRKQILLFLAALCQVSGSIPPLLFPAHRQFHFFWVVAAPAVAGINLPLLLAATFRPLCFSEQISLYWGVGEHQPQLAGGGGQWGLSQPLIRSQTKLLASRQQRAKKGIEGQGRYNQAGLKEMTGCVTGKWALKPGRLRVQQGLKTFLCSLSRGMD